MIPKRIFAIHFGEQSDLIKKCIASQKIDGYEHTLISEDNMFKGSRFVNDAFNAKDKLGVKRWCKVSDMLRLYHLFLEGGIYLDSDMEVLPNRNFDKLLQNRMFVSLDEDGNYASSALGAEKGHLLLKYIIDKVEDNFRGDGDLIWETGMKHFSDNLKTIASRPFQQDFVTLTSDYFFPYRWREKTINITENTLVLHHYEGSWTK